MLLGDPEAWLLVLTEREHHRQPLRSGKSFRLQFLFAAVGPHTEALVYLCLGEGRSWLRVLDLNVNHRTKGSSLDEAMQGRRKS